MSRTALVSTLLCLILSISFAQKKSQLIDSETSVQSIGFVHNIPFRLVDKLMFIQAKIDNQTGWLLIDTGFPDLLINAELFKNKRKNKAANYLKDLAGKTSEKETTKVNIQIEDILLKGQIVGVLDLSILCKNKNLNIIGILGYDVLARFELFIDYKEQMLTLFKLDGRGNRKNKRFSPSSLPIKIIPLKKYRHFLYLNAKIDNQALKLGLDLGAEMNVLNASKSKKYLANFTPTRKINLITLNGKKEKVQVGKIKAIKIANLTLDFEEVLLLNLTALNETKILDGLLGYDFFSNWKVAINYRKQTLSLWHRHDVEELSKTITYNLGFDKK